MEQSIINEIVRTSVAQAGGADSGAFPGERETLAEAEGFMRAVVPLGAAPCWTCSPIPRDPGRAPAQALYRDYMKRLFRLLTQCRRFTQIRLPTAANAEGTGLAPEAFTRRMKEACRMDCAALHRSCKDRIAGLNAFLAALPPEGRVVWALGLGMNPDVQTLCGCIVLDEKAAGAFHIALGANDMFGNRIAAPLHIDLVGQGLWTLEEEHQHG